MEWREDARLAKAGDDAARERLREYLTPFAHGVLIAWAPAHVADSLVPRVLDEVMGAVPATDESALGALVVSIARKLGRPFLGQSEQAVSEPAIQAAREKLSALRSLPDTARELLFLRLIEGIPGPELAEVVRLTPSEVRHELERGATEASSRLGKTQFFGDDGYLWELAGAPAPLLAELEMQLPSLRFDPLATPPPPADLGTAGTFQDLKPVTTAAPSVLFAENERTAMGEVGTEPGVLSVTPAGPNPFEKQASTIAATDLPVEAQAQNPQVPWDEPAPRAPSNRPLDPVSGRPVPQVREGEKSGRSNSGKRRGESAPKLAPSVTREAPKADDDEGTEAKVPALIVARDEAGLTNPGAMLGRPTMVMPVAVGDEPIANQETRVAAVPVGPAPTARPPPPIEWLRGASPFFIAGFLTFLGLGAWGLSLYTTEHNSRANWKLTEVVVAAEDLPVGQELNYENLAFRAVPEPFQSVNVVMRDAVDSAIGQHLAFPVQAGDPIFYNHFLSMLEASRKLNVPLKSRGVTVAINRQRAVGHWVKPGDLVDVLWTNSTPLPMQSAYNEHISTTVLRGVRVLATGKMASEIDEQFLSRRDRDYTHITLQVPPSKVEDVALACAQGRLTLTLRNEDDLLSPEERGLRTDFTNEETLLSGERAKKVQARRKEVLKAVQQRGEKK